MDYEEHSVRETASTGKTGGKIPELAGWEEVGYYASCLICASGDMRRLIDRDTGAVIAQHRFSQAEESVCQMPDCELLTTCPFFNNKAPDVSAMTERDKEQYCQGDFGWCGRYMAFKARERESERITLLNPTRNDRDGAFSKLFEQET